MEWDGGYAGMKERQNMTLLPISLSTVLVSLDFSFAITLFLLGRHLSFKFAHKVVGVTILPHNFL